MANAVPATAVLTALVLNTKQMLFLFLFFLCFFLNNLWGTFRKIPHIHTHVHPYMCKRSIKSGSNISQFYIYNATESCKFLMRQG